MRETRTAHGLTFTLIDTGSGVVYAIRVTDDTFFEVCVGGIFCTCSVWHHDRWVVKKRSSTFRGAVGRALTQMRRLDSDLLKVLAEADPES